jgi:hypothetical protein
VPAAGAVDLARSAARAREPATDDVAIGNEARPRLCRKIADRQVRPGRPAGTSLDERVAMLRSSTPRVTLIAMLVGMTTGATR